VGAGQVFFVFTHLFVVVQIKTRRRRRRRCRWSYSFMVIRSTTEPETLTTAVSWPPSVTWSSSRSTTGSDR